MKTQNDIKLTNRAFLSPLLWRGRERLLLLFLCLTVLYSCNQEVDFNTPIDYPVTSVNYFAVSETLPLYTIGGSSNTGGIGVFVDTTEYMTYIPGSWSKIPYFAVAGTAKEGGFPFRNSNESDYTPIYISYKAGTHNFIFSYLMVNEKTITTCCKAQFDLKQGAYSCIYFADAPGDTANYQAFKVDEPLGKATQDTKVAINLVNLSYDAGNLKFKIQKTDAAGNVKEEAAGLSQNMAYGTSSGYVSVDTLYAQNGYIAINIYNANDSLLTVTGVPASAGHSYEVLARGFVRTHQKQVIAGLYQGAIKYTKFTITPNFRTLLRQTY